MKRKKWTHKEIKFLYENYQKMTAKKIGKKLGRTRWSITNKVNNLGLQKGYGNRNWLYNTFNKEPSEDLAYILGVIKGDGCVTEVHSNGRCTSQVQLNTVDKPFAESFVGALEEINLNPRMWLQKFEDKKNQWRVSATSKKFFEWYSNLDLKSIKENLLTTDEIKKEFVRGFYESEGNNRPSNRTLRMFSSDEDTIKFVQKITKDLGFNFRLKKGLKFGKEYFTLIIYKKEERIKFLKKIQPVIYRKSLQKLLDYQEEKRKKIKKLGKYGESYSEWEKKFILNNHKKYSLRELAEILGRTRGSISGTKSKLIQQT